MIKYSAIAIGLLAVLALSSYTYLVIRHRSQCYELASKIDLGEIDRTVVSKIGNPNYAKVDPPVATYLYKFEYPWRSLRENDCALIIEFHKTRVVQISYGSLFDPDIQYIIKN